MKYNVNGTFSLVLVLMAASSLVSMISTLKIDSIIHGDLYNYGLQFSYRWAAPYWTMTTIAFTMGWFNIIIAIAFQFYVLMYGRKEPLKSEIPTPIEPQVKSTEKIEEYKEKVAEPVKVIQKKKEETQKVAEAPSQHEQTEAIQAGETDGQKEQESKTTEESKIETEETSKTTSTEPEQKTAEKSEDAPILVGVPEEEPQTLTEDTPQQQIEANLS